MNSVFAVVVTYNPDPKAIRETIASIFFQVVKVVVVDNGSANSFEAALLGFENVLLIKKSDNHGIAAAQNIGINEAIRLGAKYIMLSDQDSVFPCRYIDPMIEVFLGDSKMEICCVAPIFKDKNKRGKDGVIVPSIYFKRIHPVKGMYEVMQVIASGMVIKVSCLEKVGLMCESLFIDWVDIEWCWRAREKGYKIFVNADVTICHNLGDHSVDLIFREINVRSPVRHYYITRNAFYLSLYSKSIPLTTRSVLFFKSFRYIFGFPLIGGGWAKNCKAVSFGMFDGFFCFLGRCSHKL
jgi:rhamnosyltransferase